MIRLFSITNIFRFDVGSLKCLLELMFLPSVLHTVCYDISLEARRY